jgi:hypothetical protein
MLPAFHLGYGSNSNLFSLPVLAGILSRYQSDFIKELWI